MKKTIIAVVMAMAVGSISASAQGGFQRRTVEERIKMVHDKLDSAFKLEAAKLSETDSVFADYYRATDKLREELMNSGAQGGFQAMREKMQPLADARDEKLKKIFNDEQFKIWKEQIEPAMRPRRPGGGGNR